jgi:hypothetical protein
MSEKNILIDKQLVTYYGNFRALVVDDEDPRDVGRIKVRVIGVYQETVPHEDLPWAIPALSMYRSGGDNTNPSRSTDITLDKLATSFNNTGTGGIFTVPARGNHVWIWFDQGNHMHPVYFAMCATENDFLKQKQYIKDKINTKIEQIKKLKSKFTPENEVGGTDWGDLAYINARQGLTTSGINGKNNISTGIKITGGKYTQAKLNISTPNMYDVVDVATGTDLTLDIKPLNDEETGVNRSKSPYKFTDEQEKAGDTGRNINRYVTSFTTQGGTTIIIDNREGQENYYMIHKNYMENIDQDGSRKIFIGRNDPKHEYVKGAKNDYRNTSTDTRSNDELAVDGDKKIHVLGNFVTYIKGNILTQCDKNMQIDVNDSYGIRLKKGDFDIILNGETDQKRDNNSERENSKKEQKGDLNINIQKGMMQIHAKENANIHVEGNVNLKVEKDMRTHVLRNYHLHVDQNYYENITGSKFVTVGKNVEIKYNSDSNNYVKTYILGNEYKDISGYSNLIVSGKVTEKVGAIDLEIKLNYNIKVAQNYNKTALNIVNKCGTFDINASSNLRCSTSSIDLTTSELKVVASSSSFSGNLNVGGSGNFGVNVSTTLTNLNSYFGHTHAVSYFWSDGGGAATVNSLAFSPSGSSPSISSPSSPSTPILPSPPLSASNQGGIGTEKAYRQLIV